MCQLWQSRPEQGAARPNIPQIYYTKLDFFFTLKLLKIIGKEVEAAALRRSC